MQSLAADPGLMVWTWITFGGLFLLLARFAFRPLRRAMDEREKRIHDSIARADAVRAEAEELLSRNEKQLAEARNETRRILDEGHRVVDEMKREAAAASRRDAEHMVAQARREIDRELARSLDELKSTVANLSVRIAREVIRDRIDETQHERLADEFIERLKTSHARSR